MKSQFIILFAILIFAQILLSQDSRKYDYKLVHGLFGSGSVWNNTEVKDYIINNLKVNDIDQIDYGSMNTDPINNIVIAKKNDLEAGDGDENIFIGHSMGGLVSRGYVETFGPYNVSTIVTIGTPHMGSALANVSGTTGAISLVADCFSKSAYLAYITYLNNLDAINQTLHWSWIPMWDNISDNLISSGINNPSDYLDDLWIELALDYGVESAADDIFHAFFGAFVDLRPGSAFLNNLNSNQLKESSIDRFSIAGLESDMQMYKILGTQIFDNEDSFTNLISGLILAYNASIVMTQANMDAFNYNIGLAKILSK